MRIEKLSFLVNIALLLFASCTDEAQELAYEQSQEMKQIVMTIQDFQPEVAGRTLYEVNEAVKCIWAENDTVGVFPEKGAQAYFPMASGAGTKNATFDGEGWALKDGKTYASYYPYIGKAYLDRNAVPVSYAEQTQTGNASTAHLGAYDYMWAAPITSELGSAQFMFKHLSALIQLKLTIPQPTTLTSVRLVAESNVFAVEGKVDIMVSTPSIIPSATTNEVVLELQDVATTEANQIVVLYMMLPPADLGGQTLKAILETDKGVKEVDFEGKKFQAGMAYGLMGTWVTDGSYKDGVVSLVEAGTMRRLLGDDYLSIKSLKVVGPINGDDVRCLRQMLGAFGFDQSDCGRLATLDLSGASIVEGGECYCEVSSSEQYYTSNDVIGYRMFDTCDQLKNIVLPDGIISIGEKAFQGCVYLSSVIIGNDVVSIGDYAFHACKSLTSVDIPTGVTSIGEYAFRYCYSLTSIDIPDSIVSIGESAFSDCSSLTFFDIPNGVTSIGGSTFHGCSSLTSIDIPNSVTSIGNYAFANCHSLTSIDIPDGVTSIGEFAFAACSSLTSIGIPYGVTSISKHAFRFCSSLASIDIPDGVTSINEYAFDSCTSLTSIDISNSVTSIGNYAFANCHSLTSIDIPDGVTSINEYTFQACSSLTSVTMGAGIVHIDQYAFGNCSSLIALYCYAITPPILDKYYDSFPEYGEQTILYVPKGYLSTYQSSSWASYFKTITEME